MITDPALLYNRHRLSLRQIEMHFGPVGAAEQDVRSPSEDVFQTLSAFLAVVDRLQAEGIRFVPLKGPVLSDLIYRDFAARRFYDLDFLIHPSDLQHVLAVLDGLDYAPLDAVPTTPEEWRERVRWTHQFLCQHRSEKADIELHWSLFTEFTFPGGDFDRIYETMTVPYALEGRTVRKLSNEIEFVFILAHGAKHGWFRLKWLVDANDYLAHVPLDLGIVERLLAAHRMARIAPLYNAVARRYLPQPALLPFAGARSWRPIERQVDRCLAAKDGARAMTHAEGLAGAVEVPLFAFFLAPDRARARGLVMALPRFAARKLKRARGRA
jgi:hypothetical protein